MATAEIKTLFLKVAGMTCGNCGRNVAKAIEGVQGVIGVRVDVPGGAAIATITSATSPAALVAALAAAGYEATPSTAGNSSAVATESLPWALIAAAAATSTMMVLEWGFGTGMTAWYHWLSFALAAPVQYVCGRPFYEGGMEASQSWEEQHGHLGGTRFDHRIPVQPLGTRVRFGGSSLFHGRGGHPRFRHIGALGRSTNVPPRGSRSASVDEPGTGQGFAHGEGCRNGSGGGLCSQRGFSDPQPGDRVPVDGRVVEGQSHAEESMLTGEPAPRSKKSGDLVHAGTINVDGRLVFKATATGEDTALARIIQAVRRAQQSRADIQRLADRISERFVPVVVVMALLTACWWGFFLPQAMQLSHTLGRWLWMTHGPETAVAAAIYHAASVLIVACPCAMGLATPVAIMAGTNAASRLGILVRDGVALEKAGNLTTVVMDKTGTLTEGRLSVEETRTTTGSAPAAEWLSIVATLAQGSRHPASTALHGISPSVVPTRNWREVRGSGIEGEVSMAGGWKSARLGSPRWLTTSGDLPPSKLPGTQVALELDGKVVCVFTLTDQPKPGAAEAIRQLHNDGLRVVVLSGDDPAAVAAMAAKVGLDATCAFGGLSPEDKAATIRKFQQAGERVAFIGDGINDAPALAQADLGITVSNASDVARETAGMVLLRDDLLVVPQAIHIAGRTLSIIRQNLFWAFFYNAAAIPLAMCGLFSPMLSAIAMGASDIVVVGNALRLLGSEKR